MRIRLFSLFTGLALLLNSGLLFSQQLNYRSLEKSIEQVVSKVAPATVSACSYDTAHQKVTGPTFSAVVVSADGLILTAAHAAYPGKNYRVTFPDGKTVMAACIGSISENDASIMKIKQAGNWPYAEMGWSTSLPLFSPCISLGYPANMPQSGHPLARFGYVTQSKLFPGFLCNTALMEPGDSGGPLFDLDGRVIGIHSRIWQSMDANFEVPVDEFRKYWKSLQSGKNFPVNTMAEAQKVEERPAAYPIKPIPELENMAGNFSSLLASVEASKFSIISKIKNADSEATGTLVAVPDAAPNSSYIISKSSIVGDEDIKVSQNQQSYTATVIKRDTLKDLVLLQLNAAIPNSIKVFETTSAKQSFRAGMFLLSPTSSEPAMISILSSPTVSFMPRTWYSYLGMSAKENGHALVIENIEPRSKAIVAKLKTGDRIVRVNGTKIKTAEEFEWLVSNQQPSTLLELKVKRHGFGHTRKVEVMKKGFLGPDARHPAEQFEGGKSVRADGFRKTFIHDARLYPSDCGSAVIDSEGRFMGINIARVCRTSSLAMPADEVRSFIEEALGIHTALSKK